MADITTILELRILPPLAIGRLGSSPEPMDNYALDDSRPVGYRHLLPADTLHVDRATGRIAACSRPTSVEFRDVAGRIKPVSPFLEVWAQFEPEGPLLPLTEAHLRALGLAPTDLRWTVRVGNHKAFRRTGQPDDKVLADTGEFSDFGVRALLGQCANFLPGKTLPLGTAQYVQPTAEFPEIRLRFTPAAGYVYGPPLKSGGKSPHIHEAIYDAGPGRGTWKGYRDPEVSRTSTVPANIYAGYPSRKNPNLTISRGYLDDECDGEVAVALAVGGRELRAYGRIVAGPPTFAPDSLPVRTVADELEQALLGPTDVTDALPAEVIHIIRRALETVRLMNTAQMNAFSRDRGVGMARMDFLDVNRAGAPLLNPTVMDSLAIQARHERVLLALESGTLAWFARILRNYDEVGDLSDAGRAKMPALMRGADARHLALTRRQVAKVRWAAAQLSHLFSSPLPSA
jgi:hypothetical protein